MPLSTLPLELGIRVYILLRQTLAAPLLGDCAHVFDCELYVPTTNWTPRALFNGAGDSLPLMSLGASPPELRFAAYVILRQTPTPSLLGNRLHLLNGAFSRHPDKLIVNPNSNFEEINVILPAR